MSVHKDDVLMAGNPETLEKIKEMINMGFNFQESQKLRINLGV